METINSRNYNGYDGPQLNNSLALILACTRGESRGGWEALAVDMIGKKLSFSGSLSGYTLYQLLIHEWTKVLGAAPHAIVHQAEYYHRPRHEYAIVHCFRLHGGCGWPETPEDDEYAVDAGERIVNCAPDAADTPWSPYQSWMDDIVIFPAIVVVAFVVFDG